MEKDTILLSVEKYNELRDFRKEIEAENTYRVDFGYWGNSIAYVSTDEAIKEMSQRLETLEKENEDLKNPDKKQPSIDEIKAMSWWKFRKWKGDRL
jgi:chaperonin cofactor prefoldin